MNFLPGKISDGSLHFPLATIPLLGDGLAALGRSDGRVVVGIRPEDFEDAALAGDRGGGTTITALVDVLESTGSDVYAHLSLGEGGGNGSGALDESVVRHLQAAAVDSTDTAPAPGLEVIARLDSTSRIGEGTAGKLWLDTSRLHLFDPDTGERLEG
jgi:multiple sugar transport system ATP-binding protein